MRIDKYISFLFFLQMSTSVYSQDTTLARFYQDLMSTKYLQDSAFASNPGCWLPLEGGFTFQMAFDFISHFPDDEDVKIYESHKHLIGQLPTEKNHVKYIQLAMSLWDLEKTNFAEKMFLNIVNSKIKSYTTTYYHSSDIPGDTTSNLYGYGS